MQMSTMRPVSTMVLVGMWLGGFSACSSVLMNAPVSKNAEGWVVTLSQAKEGPDEYVGEAAGVTPREGEKFIWTLVTVKNEGSQEQTFSYEACVLEGKGESRQPLIIDRNAEVNAAADGSEPFAPGQERTRKLIYKYPKDQRPTRMKCGTIMLPIQKPR
jgi:hypothetical protein